MGNKVKKNDQLLEHYQRKSFYGPALEEMAVWLAEERNLTTGFPVRAPVQRTMHVLSSHLPAMGTSLPSETVREEEV